MEFVATCLFGLEKLLGEEIDALGYKRLSTIDGRVCFEAPAEAMAVCSIHLRYAERLLILLKRFKALSFNELFEEVKSIRWAELIGRDDAFPVRGHSVRSKLFSIPDCQKIIKKAAVDSMSQSYGIKQFSESGVKYQIDFFILNDEVSIMIDTSGESLHKRGYRAVSGIAPLRETLAAAMVSFSRPRENVIICDPLCGSGTIAIEAGMISTGTAPGIFRSFAGEEFPLLSERVWSDAREKAKSEIHSPDMLVFGSDIDEKCVLLARENAAKAGVSEAVSFKCADVADFVSPLENARGTIVTNPPYGERMLDLEQAREIYSRMGKAFSSSVPSWQLYVISSDAEFERYFGRKCDKRRPLYNGMIKCSFYQYFKRRD